MKKAWIVTLFLLPVFCPCGLCARAQTDRMKDFRQVIPRGRIASIDHPTFVPAKRAKIAADSWVLGVVINGKARAYSLNLLNQHEIVNDQAGDKKFAAVW